MKKKFPDSHRGHFLIAESNMSDPNFFQTVVLILEHNEEGAFGLVVNRKSQLTLGDLMPGFQNEKGYAIPVYVGGPVQQEYLFALHSEIEGIEQSPSAIKPVDGVVFEPAFMILENYLKEHEEKEGTIHLFLGYSGWAPGQLESEMERGSWMTLPAKPNIVFHPNPEEGWRAALREKGGIYKVFADSNQDPALN